MYKVYKKAFTFSPDLEKYIISKARQGDPIFNNRDGEDKDNDNKRIQYDLENSEPITKHISSKLQDIIEHFGYKGTVNDPVILKSYAYCKRQRLHRDYDLLQLQKIDESEYPHGIIVGISNNCRFIVSPDGLSRKYVHFDKGDVVIFRGDTIHAGAEYHTENIRMHAYVDTESHDRIKNETFYV